MSSYYYRDTIINSGWEPPDPTRLDILGGLLGRTGYPAEFRVTIRTPYGLIVEASSEGPYNIRLDDPAAEPKPDMEVLQGIRFFIKPNEMTDTCIQFEEAWKGNMEHGWYGGETPEQVLRERYSEAWCNALMAWAEKYKTANMRYNKYGREDTEVFPDRAERIQFHMEGLLLGAWLALQPGVNGVKYESYGRDKRYVLVHNYLSEVFEEYLNDLHRRELRP
ncbi:hypothetical protein VTJ49DRAFT_4059 [Mycothermus thermophilus]|uniref:Uncharacterized protein n=1 Tax=Humicola insolens TaxID=85995 RepID=A0ABR3V859_HUMIN